MSCRTAQQLMFGVGVAAMSGLDGGDQGCGMGRHL